MRFDESSSIYFYFLFTDGGYTGDDYYNFAYSRRNKPMEVTSDDIEIEK